MVDEEILLADVYVDMMIVLEVVLVDVFIDTLHERVLLDVNYAFDEGSTFGIFFLLEVGTVNFL